MASYGMPGGGSSGDMDNINTGGNLDSLLAQLRRQSGNTHNPQQQQDSPTSQQAPDLMSQFSPYHQASQSYYGQNPAADSPRMEDSFDFPPAAPTPPVGGGGLFNSAHPPSMFGPRGNDDRTANLLNLLKYSQGNQSNLSQTSTAPQESFPPQQFARQPSGPSPAAPSLIHQPSPSAADPSGLLAALMKGRLHDEVAKTEPAQPQQSQAQAQQQPSPSNWGAPPSENTQQYLLNLLNRPKPSQNDAPLSSETTKSINLTPQSTSESANEHGRDFPSLERTLAESVQDIDEPIPAVPDVPTSTFDFESKASGSPQLKFDVGVRSGRDDTPSKASMFAYNNPFDDIAAATSPLNRTPKTSTTPGASASPGAPSHTSTGPIQILKKPGSAQATPDLKRLGSSRSPLDSPDHIRRKIDSVASSGQSQEHPSARRVPEPTESFSSYDAPEKSKETVAEAVGDLARTADKEAREAVARAEEEQAQARIAQELQDMMAARTDQEFVESAALAAQDIKKELEREENKEVLQATLRPEVAQAVKDIVDEAAQGPVADSWESADADEIVVIEETTNPVKVFNFPMKPWISISIQEGANETRPVFRDESILDIARLKKEFDQIDRNLVAASENYMAYGMSKAGGLRVIRQDDGRDAKLFTDTKDRIFNLAISTTPADHTGAHKETIIGTGISGTVYWVQIKDGDRDHLEDANPEQYGFALPPISSQEGDAPGGVLKTRARASTNHPEYFAVGRGKAINIIWPSFVLQNGLIKPGHDRLVDTDRLAKECSLKINTGKAGKDFTFSQDDTMVVSLDKSGRVKFWDVRDLTAAKEGSDARNPMPAETSLEVKEPLMTLTTTPEGEKAWPTSVLLLDKLRPYQKRGALRYMIVGMKQNHTLQLWDLALGKPVQEFNLPHSKESDAVCSVMYHPPSGMIVVGHPTRNSIYFLHLSAPKYTLKNQSQVDYIQRLVAQDSSIPQPESTAVISGMREYSFANKGTLRSLQILQNPSSASDSDEPTLFELYAMHSKGVACLMVKQAELGWTKDNKVMAPVDAVTEGVVKITKLKTPPAPQTSDTHGPDESVPSQIRLAVRTKEAVTAAAATSSQEDAPPQKAEARVSAKQKEAKEDESSQHPIAPPVEKPEKKSRKKKAAAERAAAAAAQAERENGLSNGSSNSPRATPAAFSHKAADRASQPTVLAPTLSSEAIDSRINAMESRITSSLSLAVRNEMEGIRRRVDDDMRLRDERFTSHQGNLLEMVSDVLNGNTQRVLTKIIHEEFEASVTPMVRDVVSRSISEQLGSRLNNSVSQSVQKEMQKLVPNAVTQALSKPDLLKSTTDKMVHSLTRHVEEQIYEVLDDKIIPKFTNIATQAAQRVGNDVRRQASEQIARLEQLRAADMTKIDQLVALTARLTDTVSTMAAAQSQFQGEFLKFQSQAIQQQAPAPAPVPAPSLSHGSQGHGSQGQASGAYNSPIHTHSTALQPIAPPSNLSQQTHRSAHTEASGQQAVFQPTTNENRGRLETEQTINTITNLLENETYDEAMITWLHATRQEDEIWNAVLYKYRPNFIPNLNPLLVLSIAATISNQLEGPRVREKLNWIEAVLVTISNALPSLDGQTREVTPKIMGVLKARLEHLFLRISSAAPGDMMLKNLSSMVQVINQIIHATSSVPQQQMSPY